MLHRLWGELRKQIVGSRLPYRGAYARNSINWKVIRNSRWVRYIRDELKRLHFFFAENVCIAWISKYLLSKELIHIVRRRMSLRDFMVIDSKPDMGGVWCVGCVCSIGLNRNRLSFSIRIPLWALIEAPFIYHSPTSSSERWRCFWGGVCCT